MKTSQAVGLRATRAIGVLLTLAVFTAVAGLKAGQNGPDPKLAAKIIKKKTITVLTPTDIVQVQDPLVIPGGLQSEVSPSLVIPWSDVQEIRCRGRATLTGMWIGAGLVGALGTAWGIAWMSVEAEGIDAGELMAGTCVFAAAGAAAGALIGTLFPNWKTLYRAPAKPPMLARVSLAPAPRGGAVTLTLAF